MDGSEIPEFVLNRTPFRDAKIIVAGPNFGCGSSRERAVWALMRFGIRCVVAPSFADIFRENAFQNGLLPVAVDESHCARLGALLEQVGDPTVTVDLGRCTVEGPQGWRSGFTVPQERRTALMEGLDEVDVILRLESAIDAFQKADCERRPWIYLDR